MAKTKSIEQKVAETLLQQPEEITIGERNYEIAPPSIATIVMASQEIASMPKIQLNKTRVLEDTLAFAKDCAPIGQIIAVLILGAKRIRDKRYRKFSFGFLKRKLNEKDELAQRLLEDLTPRELASLAGKLLGKLQVSDFFEITTFLTEINLTQKTKVETEQTASGQ